MKMAVKAASEKNHSNKKLFQVCWLSNLYKGQRGEE